MRGKNNQKIITLLIVVILLVPTISCMSLNQENDEQLESNNMLAPEYVTDIVADENILVIQDDHINYLFDITNKERPKKRAIIGSSSRRFIKNFIYKDKLLSYILYYDNLESQKYKLQIYDLAKIRNPELIESFSIESSISSYRTSFQFFTEDDEIIIYRLEQNETIIYKERINIYTLEYQCQKNTTEELMEEKGILLGIKKRENKVYIAFTDENSTLGIGIFALLEDCQLVKEKIMKSNETIAIYGLDFIIEESYLVTRMDIWAHGGYRAKQYVYDLTNGENLTKISTYEYKDIGMIHSIRNNYLYTLEFQNFSIYEINNWENIELVGKCECQYPLYKAGISNNYAYINQVSYHRTNYLVVIDITNPQEMEVVKIFGTQLIKSETQLALIMAAVTIAFIAGILAIILTPILIVRRRRKIKRKIEEIKNWK
ncbi:MAG: hypothetical protein FK733_09005 [Asgard group archaeon]|nr:hypothetical protein [Asgard group archaeon]